MDRRFVVVPLPDDITVDDLNRAFAKKRLVSNMTGDRKSDAKQMLTWGAEYMRLRKSRPGGPYRMKYVTSGGGVGPAMSSGIRLELTEPGTSLAARSVSLGSVIAAWMFVVVAAFIGLLAVGAIVGDHWNWGLGLPFLGIALLIGGIGWALFASGPAYDAAISKQAVETVFDVVRDSMSGEPVA